MTPFVDDPDFTLHVGDALSTLQAMPAESVHCCVTSPPYLGLRDYGTGTWDGGDAACDHLGAPFRTKSKLNENWGAGYSDVKNAEDTEPMGQKCSKCGATRVDQQLGLEPTPDEYVTRMVAVIREVRRVLRADGTLWLNIGDSYNNRSVGRKSSHQGGLGFESEDLSKSWAELTAEGRTRLSIENGDMKEKDLVGIPWMLAFALRADGWYLRSDIIWAKPNPMPESVTDRPTKAHEYLFLLTKSPRYFYDGDAIREAHTAANIQKQLSPNKRRPNGVKRYHKQGLHDFVNPSGRNKRSVWEIATEPYPDAHFATFPQALVEPCIKAGTSEHGCCPECGAPWERRVETDETLAASRRGTDAYQSGGIAKGATWAGATPGVRKHVTTIGWRPSCDCGADLAPMSAPVPCTVLDPFLGSGTTAQVARRLGRRSIGIELNPEYAQLAARRLQQLSLFAVETAEA